jgi:hypothetical protein
MMNATMKYRILNARIVVKLSNLKDFSDGAQIASRMQSEYIQYNVM